MLTEYDPSLLHGQYKRSGCLMIPNGMDLISLASKGKKVLSIIWEFQLYVSVSIRAKTVAGLSAKTGEDITRPYDSLGNQFAS